jgi:hypothetical protein
MNIVEFQTIAHHYEQQCDHVKAFPYWRHSANVEGYARSIYYTALYYRWGFNGYHSLFLKGCQHITCNLILIC